MAEYSHPFLKFPMNEKELEELAQNERDYLLLHGGSLRLRESKSNDEVRFAPFFLFPSLFPERGFRRALLVQTAMNKLMMGVAYDRQFLTHCLKNTIEVDDFTAGLFKIYTAVMDEGLTQPITLGLLRVDYFACDLSDTIYQVEANVIASGWSGMSVVSTDMHRYGLTEMGHLDKLDQIPVNTSLSGIAEGMIHAWDKYNVEGAAILFVVEERTINICDQRFHEFQIYKQRPGIKVLRRTHGELVTKATLTSDRRLMVDGYEIALVYYRMGYSPDHYPTDKEWSVRLLIERSKAIKSPSIQLHLSGTKKVQQELSRPGALERFLNEEEVKLCRSVFTGLYSLDMNEEGDAAVKMAIANPERFVLKPQREGGGNNVYGLEIAKTLSAIKNSPERTGYILMDLIEPHVQPNYLLRAGQGKPQLVQAVGELGIFGYILSDANQTYCNECCGFTLRSKPSTVLEGGVIGGSGAMDSPFLVSSDEHIRTASDLGENCLCTTGPCQ
ncbi:glutathione synthetase-like isoform X1 [Amphibalanus amphitrite]|uniref:glutathione synthetase-like isoform X1 n=1 Tax=Amphibalanus amphitrite TaxID=1232801 RepID=UPI001C904989|nr:glutathione synthetase-like isoform X1 [Amphibalanus amphitrite]XP_043200670.1 glutathione synthetase-like isoform X1 [Amphibalanus amphitrite]XP_043200679.1 glutathione synthetase-like isoform X1 [Amphibalanus amphitrite]XP_043200690.1 glutathione synthetase-like isoform X1 [Amphibalanus amphitrite]XP_043200701.1 glutathione synthetase-like isoform X1 [Amphibalanus amphitrite]